MNDTPVEGGVGMGSLFDASENWELEADWVVEEARATDDTVFIGFMSGELRLCVSEGFNDLRGYDHAMFVTEVSVSRVDALVAGRTDAVLERYHAVVKGYRTDGLDEESVTKKETFGSARAAYGWVEETVPDFDLFPVEVLDLTKADAMPSVAAE